ncbi:TAP-like protein-domain-containing protein [Cyathus striatus]|nr:TAP-like protein-domain-containing protein [Cyathus striatus]
MFTKPRPPIPWLRLLVAIVIFALIIYIDPDSFFHRAPECAAPALSADVNAAEDGLWGESSWDKTPPSHKLNWVDCYPGRQCARLITPLNYSEPQGDIAIIALIRKPAGVPPNSEDYRGPVLFNPGGPGGSGVDMVLGRGDTFADILGPQFDIVSFDPRGVKRSTPKASFFSTSAERALWGDQGPRVINSSSALTERWARAKIEGQLAKENDKNDYLRHINTDQTARDMLHIVRAHGREKILYWGFSYGSILGATFASMFPDKIERLIIDGVADAENYFATLWSNNLRDTDKTLQSFFDSCSKAGPDACPFYAPTPSEIANNLTSIINAIYKTPIPVYTSTSYGLLDYNRLKSTLFTALYKPYAAFPLLAQGLADLVHGNATGLYTMLEQPLFKCACTPQNILDMDEGGTVIRCNDGKKVPGSLEATREHYEFMKGQSQWGENWVLTRIGCSAWPDLPKTHFQGPFVGNTSHPILLIGNTADPVTPLWAAKKMSRGFKSSIVLTQDSPGHCSLAAPSVCTQKYIREYFVNGTLPKEGTVCTVDEDIFPSSSLGGAYVDDTQARLSEMGELDYSLLQAVKSVSSSYDVPVGPLGVPW